MADRSNAAWNKIHAEVYAVCRKLCRCPDKTSIALCQAWKCWHDSPDFDGTPNYWGVLGARRAWGKRDLIATGQPKREPFMGLVQFHGCVADEKQDYSPSPADQAIWRDVLEGILIELTPSELQVFQLASQGMRPEQIARNLGRPLAAVYSDWQSLRDVVAFFVQ